jgi:hypothetical protein
VATVLDNLIALAAEQAWHEIARPDLAVVGWRSARTEMATGLYAMLIRHPWVVQAFGSLLLSGTGKAPRKLSRDGGNADELMHEHMAKAGEIAAQFRGCVPASERPPLTTARRPAAPSSSRARMSLFLRCDGRRVCPSSGSCPGTARG